LITLLFPSLLLPFFTKTIEANVHFIIEKPAPDASALYFSLWLLMKQMFSFSLKTLSFFFSFLCTYPLICPFCQIISERSEEIFFQKPSSPETLPDIEEMVGDIKEGIIAAIFSLGLTAAALAITFIPLVGPLIALFLSGIIFLFLLLRLTPARRGWEIQRTVSWIIDHYRKILPFFPLPALSILVPMITPFLVGLVSSLFVIQGTLLFVLIEEQKKKAPKGN